MFLEINTKLDMKGERTIHFLLKALSIVLLFETNVQTARIVTLHDMQYGMPSQYKSLKRDSSKAKRVQNNDVLRKYKMMDILDKRSAPERIPEFSTKINEQSVFDNLVRKSQERFPSAVPRLYQTSQFAQREPTSSNVQYTEIPVMLYDKAGYTTSGRYSPSVNAETGMPIQENAMNHALTGKHISELEALQGRLGKNSNNMESKGQLAQMTSIPSLCTSERDECIGGRKRGPKTARPKSVNEVYGLAVKAERKYEEGASTEKGGCVKFSEMSAELLSELERMEKFGNVKMEPRDEIPSVLKLLTSSTECDQGGSVSGRPMGAAAASDRHGRVAAEGGESGAGGAASPTQSPAALPPASERRPQRGARASPPPSPVRGASEEEEAEGAAEDVDAAFQDIAVSLGGGYPLLGRSAVD